MPTMNNLNTVSTAASRSTRRLRLAAEHLGGAMGLYVAGKGGEFIGLRVEVGDRAPHGFVTVPEMIVVAR